MRNIKHTEGALLVGLFLSFVPLAAWTAPFVNFTSPTNGQHVFNLVGLSGTAQPGSGNIQTVVFSIRELDIDGGPGRWWNGTNFQSTVVSLMAQVAGTNWLPTNAMPPLNSGQTYLLAAFMTNTLNGSASTNIIVQAPTNSVSWDPGLTAAGTLTLSSPNTNGGNYWFKFTPQAPGSGVWRVVLNVSAGEADIYVGQGSTPTVSSYLYESHRVGSDGILLDAAEFVAGTDWYFLVTSTPNSQWTLVSGDVFVHNLGALTAAGSIGTNAIIGPEGMVFFKTTMSSNTPAWRLSLNGVANPLLVKKSRAPTTYDFDLGHQNGQMLLVPPYLTSANPAGRNFFVRSDATGLNNGADWNNAWKSCADIVWGGSGVSAGDTVWLAGGLYTNTLSPTVSGTADAWIYIKRPRSTDFAATNAPGWNSSYDSQVIIDPGDHALFFYTSGLHHIYVDGRIDSGIKLVCPNTEGAAVAIKQGVDYITLTNLDLAGPSGSTPVFMNGDNRGIDGTAWNGSYYESINHLLVTHCRVHGQVNNFWLVNCFNSTIEYCKIYDSGAANFVEFHGNVCATASSTNVTWRYNEIYNHQVEGIMFIFGGCANWYIYGNLWHDGMTGVSRVLEAQDGVEGPFYFYNNTIANVGTSVGTANGGSFMPGSRGRNNIYWNTTVPGTPGFQHQYEGLPDNDYDLSNLSLSEPHGISNAPNPFVNSTNQNYRIANTTGALLPRDKGLPLAAQYNLGFEGNRRGADGAWDIGAYESGGVASSPPSGGAPGGNPASAYFVGVVGNPGAIVNLDSRVQPITDLPFGSLTNVVVPPTNFGYVTYRVQVPAQQSAWLLKLTPSIGSPALSVRRGLVPNEDFYDAAAASGTNAGAALTLLPLWWPEEPSLSEGTYYVTVYSPTTFNTVFTNGNPTVATGLTDIAAGTLADNERAYYQVTVPAFFSGAPVLGWRLDLSASSGSPSLRVRQNYPPGNVEGDGTSPSSTNGATIVPPYLGPGTWYVEIRGNGATSYSLASSVITTNTLRHPIWEMPAAGQTDVAEGLTLPLIADSGVDVDGFPLLGDQGTDLAHGKFDYYAVIVPTNNAGVLRTELQKISGNPNLYLRLNAAPTTSHLEFGDYGNKLVDRSLTVAGNANKYGNWVPLNGRYESQLPAGMWLLAVEAAGNTNARYRLRISCGNVVTPGLVQDLALSGGNFINQTLSGGDWRYYRVWIPTNPPANWVINWSRSAGNAAMFIRDTIPPGDGTFAADYSSPAFNPGPWTDPFVQSLETWTSDAKNQGPYFRYDTPGTVNLSAPPLRPGSFYYLGFWSPNASTFAISSTTSGGEVNFTNTIPFSGALTATNLPANGSLLYRIEAPPDAARLLFNASNSPGVIFALEQGTPAQFGGPAHWFSASQVINFEQDLAPIATWPWQSGYSYFLSVTNTSGAPQSIAFAVGRIFSAAPVKLQLSSTSEGNAPQVTVPGQLGTYYVVNASTNLVNWEPIYTNTTIFQFTDPDAANHPLRFYRTEVLFP